MTADKNLSMEDIDKMEQEAVNALLAEDSEQTVENLQVDEAPVIEGEPEEEAPPQEDESEQTEEATEPEPETPPEEGSVDPAAEWQKLESELGEVEETPEAKQQTALEAIKAKGDTLAAKIQEFNDYVQNSRALEGLPDWHAHTHEGKSIYEMDRDALNQYLTTLNDKGETFRAQEAYSAYDAFQKRAAQVETVRQQLETARKAYNDEYVQIHAQDEWDQVERDFYKRFPGLEQHKQEIYRHLQQRNQTDDGFSQSIANLDAQGQFKPALDAKKKAVFQAMRALGLHNQFAGKSAGTSAPSAPDAKATSKKVATGKPGVVDLNSFAKRDHRDISWDELEAAERAASEGRIA